MNLVITKKGLALIYYKHVRDNILNVEAINSGLQVTHSLTSKFLLESTNSFSLHLNILQKLVSSFIRLHVILLALLKSS